MRNTGRESAVQNQIHKTAVQTRRTEARRQDRSNGTLAFPNKVTLADRIFRRGRS
jgi:hypothetical protein